jgi:DHA1 family tetracycline resistance protein-like MFS transporter
MHNRLALLFILITVAIDSIGIGLIFPVMPDLLTDVTGADISTASLWGGVLATSFAAMQFLFGPVVGNLSDRYGRRPVMLIALAIMSVDYLIMAVAGSIWVLLVGRIVAGIAAATYATASAYIADISPQKERAKNFGYVGAAFGIGFVLGPLIGGITAELGTRAPFWFAAGIAAANLGFGFFVLPESLADKNRRSFSLKRANPFGSFRAIGNLPGLNRFLLLMFVYTVAIQSYTSVWAFFGAERFGWNAWWNGVSLALYGASLALFQAFGVAPAIRLWGEKRTAAYSMSLEAAAFVYFGFIRSGFWALACTPVAAAAGLAGPAMNGLMANATPDNQQGELQGVIASVSALAMGLSPMIMTSVFYFFTRPGAPVYLPGAPFILAAFLMAGCVFILVAGPRAKAPA